MLQASDGLKLMVQMLLLLLAVLVLQQVSMQPLSSFHRCCLWSCNTGDGSTAVLCMAWWWCS
jgi:hypothetical protein